MPVATLQEAIDEVAVNVTNNASNANFDTWLEIFGDNVIPTLKRDTLNQRTVSNWLMPSLALQESLSNPVVQTDISEVINNVFRILSAVQAAEAANRITPAQAAMVLAQYNLAWP